MPFFNVRSLRLFYFILCYVFGLRRTRPQSGSGRRRDWRASARRMKPIRPRKRKKRLKRSESNRFNYCREDAGAEGLSSSQRPTRAVGVHHKVLEPSAYIPRALLYLCRMTKGARSLVSSTPPYPLCRSFSPLFIFARVPSPTLRSRCLSGAR